MRLIPPHPETENERADREWRELEVRVEVFIKERMAAWGVNRRFAITMLLADQMDRVPQAAPSRLRRVK